VISAGREEQQWAIFVLLLVCNLATNNIKVFIAATEEQQWVPFVLLPISNVATNNVKVFSAAMETPTTGSLCSLVELRNIPYRCQQHMLNFPIFLMILGKF
jgi:hypothetical protein